MKLEELLQILQPNNIQKSVKDDLEQELKSMLEEQLKKIKEKPSKAQVESTIKNILNYFDLKTQPTVEKTLREIIHKEWDSIEKQYKKNIILDEKGKNYIKQATKNVYLDDAIVNFNEELSTRLTDKLGDKDLTLDNLVAELKKTMEDRESRLINIARTESTKAASGARLIAYEQIKKPSDRYVWDTAKDSRVTKTCKRIAERTSNGVTKEELVQIIKEESKKDFPEWTVDELQPCAHYQCRSMPALRRK